MLHEIGVRYGTDKAAQEYLDFYERVLPPPEEIDRVLEIGVFHGQSLLMWKEWTKGYVEGWDIRTTEVVGCTTRVVNSRSRSMIEWGIGARKFDLIIDDADHTMKSQQLAMSILFPHCRVFIMEDLHTSAGADNYLVGDVSTVELMNGLDRWESQWSTPGEAAYIRRNARLLGIHTASMGATTAVIANEDPIHRKFR